MDRLFIDASIFIRENFLEGRRIVELLSLCERGHFELIMPLITINEIKGNFKKSCQPAIEEHNRVLKQLRHLRNLPNNKERASKFPKLEDMCEEFNRLFDAALSKATILPYPSGKTDTIFDAYFSNKPPFGKQDKKHEFPDAFAVLTLAQWCHRQKKKIKILSTDKDFSSISHSLMEYILDYAAFLDTYLTRLEPKRIAIAKRLYKGNQTTINTAITKYLSETLDDNTLYFDFTNMNDVHWIKVNKIKIKKKEFAIASLDDDDVYAKVTASVEIDFSLEYDDEESTYYDADDKSYHIYDTVTNDFTHEFGLDITILFNIVNEKKYSKGVKIVEYNDGESLELSPDSHEYY